MLSTGGGTHHFYVASSRELFENVAGAVSGFFLDGGNVYSKISRAAGQKTWSLQKPCQLPGAAAALVREIVSAKLLGEDDLWAAPSGLSMNASLVAFQHKHSIVVPMMLQKKGDKAAATQSSVPFSRRKREIARQAKQLTSHYMSAESARPQPAFEAASDSDDNADGDGDDDDNAESDSADEFENVPAVDYDEIGDSDGNAIAQSLANNCGIETITLNQLVMRRLVTTLIHNIYMRRLVDKVDLCSATYLNLHGLQEARATYSCVEIMFVDLDDSQRSRWRSAIAAWHDFYKQGQGQRYGQGARIGTFNELVVGSFQNLVDRAIRVHDLLLRHAKYHCFRFPRLCPFGRCTVDLSYRPFSEYHTCFSTNKQAIYNETRK